MQIKLDSDIAKNAVDAVRMISMGICNGEDVHRKRVTKKQVIIITFQKICVAAS